jgi:hypothetical protein
LLILIHHHHQLIYANVKPFACFQRQADSSISLGISFLLAHTTHENGTVLNKLHKAMIMSHMLDATIHCITYSQSVCTVSMHSSAPPGSQYQTTSCSWQLSCFVHACTWAPRVHGVTR